MNFLIIATADYKPDVGGVAEYTHNLAKAIKEQGHYVLVVGRNNPNAKDFDILLSYDVLRIENIFFKEIFLKKPLGGYDYIIVNKCGSDWDKAFILSKILRIPLFIIVHGVEITSINNNKLKIKLILGLSDLVICNSNFTSAEVAKRTKTKRYVLNPSAEIKPCIDKNLLEQYRNKYNSSGKKTIILSLCRLIQRKGIDMTLKALSKIDKEYIYLIAGDGSYRKTLEQIKNEEALENVFFLGNISEKEKNILYEFCDFYIMPNRTLPNNDIEGFGITFLEANLYKKPVIGGRSGGTGDAIEDGKNGFLVDGNNSDEIADKICYLIDNKKIAMKIGLYGKERAENEFNILALTSRFLEYLKNNFKTYEY